MGLLPGMKLLVEQGPQRLPEGPTVQMQLVDGNLGGEPEAVGPGAEVAKPGSRKAIDADRDLG